MPYEMSEHPFQGKPGAGALKCGCQHTRRSENGTNQKFEVSAGGVRFEILTRYSSLNIGPLFFR